MQCSHETKRNFYSRKPPFFELNEFFTPRKLPAIRYHENKNLLFIPFITSNNTGGCNVYNVLAKKPVKLLLLLIIGQ